ncbi:MAG: amidohydrolase family protein [Pseudomonadota bacterium]
MKHLLTRFTVPVLVLLCSACTTSGGQAIDTRSVADLIVRGDHVLTMAPDAPVLRDGAVVVRAGEIVDVGDFGRIESQWRAGRTIAGEQRILMPGLVNGHTHAAMTLLRGVADDLELMTWLTEYIFPAEVSVVDAQFVRVGTELACYEMIRGGITTFVDMYYFGDAVAETVVDCGLRALVAPSVIEQTSPDAETGEQSLAGAVDFIKRWQGKHARIVPVLGAHSVYTISEPWLQRIQLAAARLNAPVAIHVAESQAEISQTAQNYDMTPVALLETLGFLQGPLIAAHVVYPDETDIQTLARHGTGAIHNPTSNMKLASGISPVVQMRRAGVAVGLGTDGAASNNDLDLWEEIRMAALLAKVANMSPTDLPALDVLTMATREGAEAIGMGDDVGSLVVGKRADLIQVATDDLMQAPTYDVTSHLVYVSDSNNVTTTIVEGVVLMENGIVLSVDADALAQRVDRQRTRIATQLSLTEP